MTGCSGIPTNKLPRAIKIELDRGVPLELAGLSVFDMSRGIRHLARAGLGMAECDICCAIFGVLCHILGEDVPETLLRMRSEYKELRQSLFEELRKGNRSEYFHTESCLKQI